MAARHRAGALPRIAAGGALLLAFAACAPHAGPYEFSFLAFGTLVELRIAGVEREAAERAAQAVQSELERLHRAWHPWSDGALGRLNRALAEGRRISVDPELAELLREAARLSQQSGGLFDPGVGALVRLWGFDGEGPPPHEPPSAKALAAWRAAPQSIAALQLADGEAWASGSLQLDLGAYAKGVAVDRAIALLRALGIEQAIVNAGGDLRGIGSTGRRPWRIGIRHPRSPGVFASLELAEDESVFTSGDYERYFEYGGRRYHHLLDPRAGEPAAGTVAVTVVATTGATADAAATALFVAGREGFAATARALGIEQAMRIDEDGTLEVTQGLARRLRLEVQPAPPIQTVRLEP